MPDNGATFGCGTLLPGVGPGNLPGFDGGGVIEGGGGGNGGNNNNGGGTRIDTVPPIGPDPYEGGGPAPGPPDIGPPASAGPTGPGIPDRGTPVPGPTSPGPPPPEPPVSPRPSYCKISSAFSRPPQSGGGEFSPGQYTRVYTATQTCSPDDFSVTDAHNTKVSNEAIDKLKSGTFTTPPYPAGTTVKVVPGGEWTVRCDVGAGAPCPDATITVTITIPFTEPEVTSEDPPPDPPVQPDGPFVVPEDDPDPPGVITPDPVGNEDPDDPPPTVDPDPVGNEEPPWTPIGNQDPIGGVLVDPGEEPRPDVTRINDVALSDPPTAGNNIVSNYSFDRGALLNQAIQSREIDLNDPAIKDAILRKKPFGIQDSSISFDTVPLPSEMVKNDTGFLELFAETIDSNLHYILSNQRNSGNWDSRRAAGVTNEVIFNSLNDLTKKVVGRIKNYDGTKLSLGQIFNLIGSRVLDGTISKVTLRFLQSMAEDSAKRDPVTIVRSTNPKVNEVAALALIDQNKVALDPARRDDKEKNLFKNWKVLSSDIDKYLPVTINGESRRYYINDDDTFINRNTLSIQDGDYFDVTIGGRTQRLFADSEKDHAYLVPEKIRQRAVSLLGGTPGRTLDVSAEAATAASIEFDSSLTSDRQPFYVLSCVLDTLNTRPSEAESFLLKDTTAKYQLMDTTTPEGLAEVNEFIKYKANKRIFILDDEDLILDYVEQTSHLHLTQTDILFDSPKTNKTLPLLVRQLPFYIMLYPTNRPDYNIFNDKSQITEISRDGGVSRRLVCAPVLNPEFTKPQTNKFIRYTTAGRSATDILGNPDTQARQSIIDPNDEVFRTAYRREGQYVSASQYPTNRQKTGFRLVKEIVSELDTNYELSINGVGKTLTEFDVFSRLNLKQFSILSVLENFNEISKSVRNGLINDVKLIPPVSRADNRLVINKTQLVQRKTTAGEDTFKQVKATNDGQNIISPNEEGKGGLAPAGG